MIDISCKFYSRKLHDIYILHRFSCGDNRTPNISSNINPLSANPTKWSNTLKQFVGKLPTNCLSVFDHFVGLALKGLR